MSETCLILLAHGSRDPKWGQPFEALLRKLQLELGEDCVRLAYMENASPSLAEAVRDAVAKSAKHFHLLPLLMSSGVHTAEDLPMQAEKLAAQYPGVSIKVLPPVGSHPAFADLLLQLTRESFSQCEPGWCGIKQK